MYSRTTASPLSRSPLLTTSLYHRSPLCSSVFLSLFFYIAIRSVLHYFFSRSPESCCRATSLLQPCRVAFTSRGSPRNCILHARRGGCTLQGEDTIRWGCPKTLFSRCFFTLAGEPKLKWGLARARRGYVHVWGDRGCAASAFIADLMRERPVESFMIIGKVVTKASCAFLNARVSN